MDELEHKRTARQVILMGAAAQNKLHQARVLIVGAGGLGCPILQQLAAAGVGHVVLIDDDSVDITNIHRQILFGAQDVGKPKVEVAAHRARALQPGINVETHRARLDNSNALELISQVDLVLDGSDSFATKYLVADACEITSTPLVWGTVLRFHGDVAVWHSGPTTPDGRGVGLRDLFPTQLPADAVPDCATAGVLGVTTSVVGGLMATAAIGWITGRSQEAGLVSAYDALPPSLRTFRVAADPARTPVTRLGSYQHPTCQVGPDLSEVVDGRAALLDIREPAEVTLKPWPEKYAAKVLPLSELDALPPQEQAQRLAQVLAPRTYVACAGGKRSAAFIERFAPLLKEHGISADLLDVPGGANAAF
ncbi:ThiF family adenylyltransferase [Corynebacterium phocae]|uniref:ThiF family adenylyltransferase n=1 Tax=Corynebacterium phocae TaxID=161895 RepID=UPI000AA099C2|nr:ThiF family adenylyltransferase [Corynebacterium phocae]